MDHLPGLTRSLAVLAAAIEDPDLNLRAELARLDRYLLDAISPTLGLTLTVPRHGNVISLTTTRSSGAHPRAM